MSKRGEEIPLETGPFRVGRSSQVGYLLSQEFLLLLSEQNRSSDGGCGECHGTKRRARATATTSASLTITTTAARFGHQRLLVEPDHRRLIRGCLNVGRRQESARERRRIRRLDRFSRCFAVRLIRTE